MSKQFTPGSETGKEPNSMKNKNKSKRTVIQVGFLVGLDEKQASSDNMNQNLQSSSSH
jgi:hypothetical protein